MNGDNSFAACARKAGAEEALPAGLALRGPRGRFAPSPTGRLHLGNAYAFLAAWLSMALQKGALILRMEDIDPDRSRPEYMRGIIDDLRLLGLTWEEGPNLAGRTEASCENVPCESASREDAPCRNTSYLQSGRLACYAAALASLRAQGLVYPCFCTRKELRMLASAPHIGDEGVPYPGVCRRLSPEAVAVRLKEGTPFSLRLNTQKAVRRLRGPAMAEAHTRTAKDQGSAARKEGVDCAREAALSFVDGVRGPQSFSFADCGGDFALRRSDAVPAYQLATAVDDALMGVTEVVRGDDLLLSTPRQIVLIRLLGFAPPAYAHIPLLRDAQGERLAKRHKSLELRALWEAGVSPRAVVGYLAYRMGLAEKAAPMSPQEAAECARRGGVPFLPSLAGRSLIVGEDALSQLRSLGG